MPRRRWRQCRHTGQFIEITEETASSTIPRILPDIGEFVSPVDGTVISSRSKLREHNKRNGVVQTQELKGEGDEARRQREKLFKGGGFDRRGRIEAIKYALEKHGVR